MATVLTLTVALAPGAMRTLEAQLREIAQGLADLDGLTLEPEARHFAEGLRDGSLDLALHLRDEFLIDLKPSSAGRAYELVANVELGSRLAELLSAVRARDVERGHRRPPV